MLAKYNAPSSLFAALKTASSISLSISTCSSVPKSSSFDDWASTKDDKTFKERFAPSLLVSKISITFTILSTVSESDFEIILPINAILLSSESSNICV